MRKIPPQLKRFIHFFQTVILPARITQLVIQTIIKWQKDECLEMGAALAYYALFSLFPICLVILSIVGMLLGPQSDYYLQLIELAKSVLPSETFKIVQQTLVNLNTSSVSAGVIGFGLLILTASKIFDALNRSVDKIWHVDPSRQPIVGVKHQAFTFVKNKIFAFLLVLSTVFVFLSSLVANLAIKIILSVVVNFGKNLSWMQIDRLMILKSLQFGISYFLIAVVVFALFKVLPSTRLYWRDVIPGSMLTAAALMGLQGAVSSGIIRIGENFRAYGVIGNVMVLLLWIYLLFQIFFIGCEFTFVFTYLFGSRRSEENPF
ncbi:MAG: YihY/virulence factor BrkB family protein [Synechocystis sp.]|nr:YihY/virulence factor BrkB family protein [Synechocystis sp.]